MAVLENEQLFLDLIVFDGLSDVRVEELKAAGYLDGECDNTEKAEACIRNFVDSRADDVIKALEEQGSYLKDKGRVMYHAGLKSTMAMEVVLEHLTHQGVIKHKRNGDYIKRDGVNTP